VPWQEYGIIKLILGISEVPKKNEGTHSSGVPFFFGFASNREREEKTSESQNDGAVSRLKFAEETK